MDFLNLTTEMDNVRVYLKSNAMSSSIFVEELPDYSDLSRRLGIMTIYFFFSGNRRFDVLGLYNGICGMKNATFNGVRRMVKRRCRGLTENDWSCGRKKAGVFMVRPRDGYRLALKGRDYSGYAGPDSFLVRKDGGCVVTVAQGGGAYKFFRLAHLLKDGIESRGYDFLIRLMDVGGIGHGETYVGE